MTLSKVISASVGVALLPAMAFAAERIAADVACAPTGEKLVYDCMIMLKGRDSGAPIEGAALTVRADMPSMPMAHNVRPVTAMEMGGPGAYRARLELEMDGIWALTLDVTGPARDRLIEKVQFGEDMAAAGMEGHDHGDMEGMSPDQPAAHEGHGTMQEMNKDE